MQQPACPTGEYAHATEQKLPTRGNLHVAHAVTLEYLGDNLGDRIARPFALAGEVKFSRALAAADDCGNIRRSLGRPKHSGDVRKDRTEHLFVVPIIRSDCFGCPVAQYR